MGEHTCEAQRLGYPGEHRGAVAECIVRTPRLTRPCGPVRMERARARLCEAHIEMLGWTPGREVVPARSAPDFPTCEICEKPRARDEKRCGACARVACSNCARSPQPLITWACYGCLPREWAATAGRSRILERWYEITRDRA